MKRFIPLFAVLIGGCLGAIGAGTYGQTRPQREYVKATLVIPGDTLTKCRAYEFSAKTDSTMWEVYCASK